MFVLRLKRRHRNGSNECFDKGLGLVSPLQHEMLADVAVGSKADKRWRAKTHLCPLWSKSGQTQARLDCPLAQVGCARYLSLWVFVSPVGAPSIAVQPPSTKSAVPVM
jgi:hypothetical protein